MSRSPHRASVACLLALVLASCATLREEQSFADPFDDRPDTDTILVTVHNYERRAATVYAYWNGMRERLGTVVSSKSETFRTKWRADEMRLGYELLGQRAVGGEPDPVDGYRSEVFFVAPGDHLDFVIQATD